MPSGLAHDNRKSVSERTAPRTTYHINGAPHTRIRLGAERANLAGAQEPCSDCGCSTGELHEPGCDFEQCPACLERVTACDCWYGPKRS